MLADRKRTELIGENSRRITERLADRSVRSARLYRFGAVDGEVLRFSVEFESHSFRTGLFAF